MKKIYKLLFLVLLVVFLSGCVATELQSEYGQKEFATNNEVNLKISDITYFEDYVSIVVAMENISSSSVEYGPLDFVLQYGDDKKYIRHSYSSREDSVLSTNGQITWELHFNYISLDDLKLVYKKDFEDKTIVISLDYEESVGIEAFSCNDEHHPLDVAICETVNARGMGAIIDKSVTVEEKKALVTSIQQIEGVKGVKYVAKETLLQTLFNYSQHYLDGTVELYALKDVFIIELDKGVVVSDVATKVEALDGITSVSYWTK